MQLHELKRRNSLARKHPRVGRGGKRGTTSGRGTKGQRSRAGHRIRPAERDLIQRLPKLRGVSHLPRHEPAQVILLSALGRLEGNVVTRETLRQAGIVSSRGARPLKILDGGDVSRKLTIRGVPVSKGARAKIEAAGGTIVP